MQHVDLVSRSISLLGRERVIQGAVNCDYFAHLPPSFNEFDDLLAVLAKASFTPDDVVDIGANVGLFSMSAAEAFPQARIFAYEPHPEAFAALSANTAGTPAISAHNLALGDRVGQLTFRPGGPVNRRRSSGSHLVADSAATDAGFDIIVSTTTLDEEAARVGLGGRTLVKIDVEGFEYDVLAGGGDVVASDQAVFYIEFNSWTLIGLRNMNPRTLLDSMMQRFRYVYRIHPDKGFTRLASAEDALSFIFDNLILHGCVDDLVASNLDLSA